VEAEISAEGFKCQPGSDGLFAHPEYCDRYLECQNGQLVRKKLCADGLGFDPDKSPEEDPCDHIHNIKDRCRMRPRLQRPQPGDGYCPRQNGVYPSPDQTECDKFYSCLNGVGSLQQCADGLHFDPDIGTCVWARESSRKGCLSALKRAQQAEDAAKKTFQNQPEGVKEGESLPNGFKCPGGKLGIHPALPHPDSCRLYYVCLNGVTPNEAGCVSGLVFNRETSKCDDPKNVPGCEHTYERPQQSKQLQKSPAAAKQIKSRPEETDSTEDLTKLLTILSNPKLKTFLKPEIADVLESVNSDQSEKEEEHLLPLKHQGGPQQGHGRKRKKRPLQTQESPDAEESVSFEPVPSNRRNQFTSKLIPKVRPTGNLENIKIADSNPEEPFLPTIQPVLVEVSTERPISATTSTPQVLDEVPRTRNRFPRPPGSKPALGQRPQLVQRPRKPIEAITELPTPVEVLVEESATTSDVNEDIIKSLLASAVDPNVIKPNLSPETQENL